MIMSQPSTPVLLFVDTEFIRNYHSYWGFYEQWTLSR